MGGGDERLWQVRRQRHPLEAQAGTPAQDDTIFDTFSTLFDADEGRGSPEDLKKIELLRRNDDPTKYLFLGHTPNDMKEDKLVEIHVTEVNFIPGINGAPTMMEVRYKTPKHPKRFAYIGRGCCTHYISDSTGEPLTMYLNRWGAFARDGKFPFYGIPELVAAIKQAQLDHSTVTILIAEGIHSVWGVRARLAHKDNIEAVAEYEREHNTKVVVIGWMSGLNGAAKTNWKLKPDDWTPDINDFEVDWTEEDVIAGVHLIPDADTAGIVETDEVAKQLKLLGLDPEKLFRAECVRNLPLQAAGWDDLNDLPKGVKERERLEQLLHPPIYERRPTIYVNENKVFEAVSAAEQVLKESGEYYQRGGELVRIGEVKNITRGKYGRTSQRIFDVSYHKLVDDLSRLARFEGIDKKTKNMNIVLIQPPKDVAQMVIARKGDRDMLPLTAVLDRPGIRADGSLIIARGYDAETGLFLDYSPGDFPTLIKNPTLEDAQEAMETLKELCPEFPFVTDADKSVYIAGLLTSVCRETLQGSPGYGFTAIKPRTGKSMLAATIHMLMSSCSVAVMGWTQREDEAEKRLDMALLTGAGGIAIDNINGAVRSSKLCMILTQPVVKIRDFGTLRSGPEVPSVAIVTLTGNHLTLADDLPQRILVSRLDANVDFPENRVFTSIDPVTQIKTDRGKFVVAALTILRAFKLAGMPIKPPSWDDGVFGDWNDWVRGAILWLGLADPLETLKVTREEDPARQKRKAMFEGLEGAFGIDLPFTSAKVVGKTAEPKRVYFLNDDGTPKMSTDTATGKQTPITPPSASRIPVSAKCAWRSPASPAARSTRRSLATGSGKMRGRQLARGTLGANSCGRKSWGTEAAPNGG